MKYVEQIKSAVLLCLVLMSICLTVMIWTYKPVYPTIEDNNSVKEVLIGEKKELKDVLKPYRVVTNNGEELIGTSSSKAIDGLIDMMQSWSVENFILIDNDIEKEEINQFMRENYRLMFMYKTTTPLNQFSNVLRFADQDLPQASFNRIVVDWHELDEEKGVKVYFLNTENNTAYRANAPIDQLYNFRTMMDEVLESFSTYEELVREGELSLYVATGDVEVIEYEYYMNDYSIDVFKNMFFPETTVLERNEEGVNIEKYQDGFAIMTLDKYNKTIMYVYPTAEGLADISPGKLLRNSFDYINEHGGFTADYRFSAMNPERHLTEYQLYVQGYPVYSNNIATKITTIWGDERIFTYRRPYYTLDIGGQTIKKIPSMEEVVEYVKNSEHIILNEIDDLMVGYYLTQDEERRLFKLEPTWFIIKENSWQRILPDDIGGVANGLE